MTILANMTNAQRIEFNAAIDPWATSRGISRIPIALGIYGQSNEHGVVLPADKSAYPTAFRSARKRSVAVPIGPAVSLTGGAWPQVVDDMWDYGYDVDIVNGAIGGLGFAMQSANMLQGWAANYAYFGKRQPFAYGCGDRGDAGDFIIEGVRVWNATVGNSRIAINSGSFVPATGFNGYNDNITNSGTAVTGASKPAALATGAVGDVVVDNGITWTCVSVTGYSSGRYANLVAPNNRMMTGAQLGFGNDPLGAQLRLHEAMQGARRVARKIIYIQNAQTDSGVSTAVYSEALQSVGGFFLDRGYEIMIGLSCFNQASPSTAGYDNLKAGRIDALTKLKAAFTTDYVHDGADLYTLMGTTGPMAAGGAYFNADNLHLNGAGQVGPSIGGVLPASTHYSNALKAFLPANNG